MTTKLISAVSAAVLVSSSFVPVAFAEEAGTVELVNVRTEATVDVRAEREGAENTAGDNKGNSASETSANANTSATSSETDTRGEVTAEAHRSAVASFVQSLLNVAGREGGIGAQVRVVARSQQESASTTAEAMTKVEGRSAFATFLFGSDYRSLGEIRSEIVTTSANIVKLKELLAGAANDAVKAELSAQVTALEASQAEVEAFVEAHENVFSLFGWFAKMFSK